MGLLAAGFLSGQPVPLRIALAIFGVFIAPALLLLPVARRLLSAEWGTVTAVLPLAAVGVLSIECVIAQVFITAHTRFSTFSSVLTWGLLTAYAAAVIVAWRRRRRNGRLRKGWWWPGGRTVLAVGLLAGTAVAVAPHYTGREDAYDHIGYVQRTLVLDEMRPDGLLAWPLDASLSMAQDPRKGAFHPMVAVVADLAGTDAAPAWSALRVFIFPLAVLAFAGFASAFVGRGVLLALTLAAFFFSYTGTGIQFVNAAAYGQNMATTWYWVALPLALECGRRRRRSASDIALALVTVGGVFAHFGVALHTVVLAATLAIFGAWFGLSRRMVPAALLVAAAVGAAVWRTGGAVAGTTNVIHAHVQGVMFVGRHAFVASPMEILRQYGMIFLGGLILLPATVLLAVRDARARLAAAFFAIPVGIAFIPPVATWLYGHGSYMVFRVLLNAPVLPAAVLTVVGLVSAARRRHVLVRLGMVGALFVWANLFVAPALRAFSADLVRVAMRPPSGNDSAVTAMLDAVARLPERSVILSDPETAYRLSAFTTDRFVAIYQQHANPYDPYALDRLRAVRDVLSPYAVSTAAIETCRSYGVNYVVVSGLRQGPPGYASVWMPGEYLAALDRLDSMPECFRRVSSGDAYVVYRFDPRGVPTNPWNGVEAPVTIESPVLRACPVSIPGGAFRVIGMAVEPHSVLPGDTVTVAIGYRRDTDTAFTPGVLFHLRFDEVSIAKRPRWPGEKYWRRFEERHGGERLRFRADVRPGHGVYQSDLWPVGVDLCERFTVRVPPTARTGTYRVELGVEPDSVVPNFHVDDLLFNRDHYSGTQCARLTVSRHVVGDAP